MATAVALLCAVGVSACTTAATVEPSRSASASVRPTPSATPTPTIDPVLVEATRRLDAMTVEQRIASLLMLHYPGTDAAALRSFVDAHGLGGFILMGDNIPGTPEELATLTAQLSADPALPVLTGIDEEGGDVTRLPYDQFAGADVLQALPAAEAQAAFTGRGDLLRSVGVDINFGVVADVTADPSSFIADRVLGTDPQSASERVAAAVAAERGRVLTTLKHFPGHGAAPGDSHDTIPATDLSYETWEAEVAPPFRAGIDAGAPVVMFGHLAYTAVDPAPASLSQRWHDILRDELGFDGVTVTDDMLMLQHTGLPEYADPIENAIRALAAGNTMLLYVLAADPEVSGVDPAALIAGLANAVRSGRLPEELVDADVMKLLLLRLSLGADGS
ncbi:glycoside hydrolase family 3 N-terminal domain-containing protein [Compostimonas suwonensis]|uniref:beta-N-acetylhexosaminidase n=1 Tax=Compostimonas suwonensis TaxID=1048394 RepID=A0A2M9BZ91_9MICO|nr:glycoside hydrolase family 3 N-terminal domain-containing protein [Compostimonas suwonensis]PJJ63401.1 beta-N-acetylhexosaminidase [Compostimonas suwonensis]